MREDPVFEELCDLLLQSFEQGVLLAEVFLIFLLIRQYRVELKEAAVFENNEVVFSVPPIAFDGVVNYLNLFAGISARPYREITVSRVLAHNAVWNEPMQLRLKLRELLAAFRDCELIILERELLKFFDILEELILLLVAKRD